MEADFPPLSILLLARAVSIMLALALDAALGDPPGGRHPVAWLGRAISAIERVVRRLPGLDGFWGGAVLTVTTVTLATGAALALSVLGHASGVVYGALADAIFIWLALAARSLAEEGAVIATHLGAGDLSAARRRLSRIVARRTDVLDESGVAKASVESMGENVVDGVIAPVLWAAVLGPAGAWLHKAASTLDSMVGYRNERYATFGTASANLDDLLAWVPARVALVIVPVAAAFVGLDTRGAWRVALADRHKHASPNSAHGEAAFAGALGVRLGGLVAYADHVTERPIIGAGLREATASDCAAAARLVMACAIVSASAAAIVLAAASRL